MTEAIQAATAATPKPMFAIVELFGHSRLAGAVSEQTFGGGTFVRVDVPEVRFVDPYDAGKPERVIPAHTRSLGPAAIYAINWTDEATATIAAQEIRHQPVQPYAVKEALRNMPAGTRDRLLGFDDEDR